MFSETKKSENPNDDIDEESDIKPKRLNKKVSCL